MLRKFLFTFILGVLCVMAAVDKLKLTDERWRELLSSEQYEILRNDGTEPAGSSSLDKIYDEGTYICAACNFPLFKSETKYDSKTGWPSFWQPIKNSVETKKDFKLIWPRTEYHCARCESHQGHVFDDGPEDKGGLRYCNNGLALKFIAKDAKLPELVKN